MTPRVLVLQHASFCPLGTLGGYLANDGIAPAVVELDKGGTIPSLDPFDALIVLGGPMDVWETEEHPWLISEKAAIRRWVRTLDRPLLGICLGHQLLADALGGKVSRAKRAEAGLGEIAVSDRGRAHPLLAGFGATKRAIQFHSSEVTALPQDGIVLASTPDCPIGAFSAGSAAFGIQYHAEATDTLVEEWTELPAGRALVEGLHGSHGVARVRTDASSALPELRANAKRLYNNFMQIVRGGRSSMLGAAHGR